MLHIYAWSQAYVFKCFKLLQTCVSSVSSGCCIYFAMVHTCFSGILDIYCKCFSCFRRMLQVFYLDVAKVYIWCCTCCNGTHQLSCMRMGSGGMEPSAAVSVGSGGGWRQGHRRFPFVRATGRGLWLLRVEPDNFTCWVGVTDGTR